MYTSINQIFVNSSLILKKVSMFSLCFADGKLVSKRDYTIDNSFLRLNNEALNDVSMYYGYNNGTCFEYYTPLSTTFTIIHGNDIFNNPLKGLLNKDLMVFVNGELISPSQYEVYADDKLYLYVTKPVTQMNTVQIYVSLSTRYGGTRTYEELTNHDKSYDDKKIPYNSNCIMIFKNGYKIDYQDISNSGGICEFPNVITPDDRIEFYTIVNNCNAVHFAGALGYLEYGPYDIYQNKLPTFYDTIIELDNLANLLIDNPRKGYFIKEVNAEGVLMVIDNHFESSRLHCITLTPFKSTQYDKSEYFLQVPEMKSIVDYLSPYDRQYSILPEVLNVFQQILLNEIYDEIQRVKDLRSLSRVDSINIDRLIRFLGMNANLHSLNLKQRRALLDELNQFYRILGTEKSYNFFNICAGYNNLNKMEQLFTYHDDLDPNHREYIDFFTKEECGAIPRKEWVYPYTDYGYLVNTVEAYLDFGEIDVAEEDEVIGEDHGYVTDKIKGKWIKWWEWDRPSNCYPTNHVHLEVTSEPGKENDDVIRKFSNHFYVLASTVLYIHDLTINYTFGGSDSAISNDVDGDQIVQYGIMTAPIYYTQKYCCTSDPLIQEPQLTTGLSNTEILELVNASSMSDYNRAKFVRINELGQEEVIYNNLNRSYVLTINTNPEDATVTFVGGDYSSGHSVSASSGSIITYTITKPGYVTIRDEIMLTKDTVLDIAMREEGVDYEDMGSVALDYEEAENMGLVSEHITQREDLGEV